MHIAATESDSLCVPMKSLTAFLELELAIEGQRLVREPQAL
jgi:hypothetical protein